MNNEIIMAPLVWTVYAILSFYCAVGVIVVIFDGVANGNCELINYIDYALGVIYTLYTGE